MAFFVVVNGWVLMRSFFCVCFEDLFCFLFVWICWISCFLFSFFFFRGGQHFFSPSFASFFIRYRPLDFLVDVVAIRPLFRHFF